MLHKIVTAPMNVMVKIGEKVKEEAEKELYDLPTIQRKLIHLQTMYEQGEVAEDDYKNKEEDLLYRYEQAKLIEMKQWQDMASRKK
ncbi:gas vesicle protein GvpG [Gracilibacillus oryzae]|uniref:Gas vesicle protein GvpG n=1 Tax=Gracilibacillus oryzae TaxID=1672701 RepID=A0A7C8GVL2_9BACI|nr:gas vesicle protein GvpG [Gracilibacillus oryzae]KAB8139230.1 gas vesicle protein GvpG [Gracilibacillus oryzae]